MTQRRASVIVRAKDKAATIEDTFLSLRAQTVPVEIVVVDSGSTDGTVAIAKRYADQIIEIPASTFSYGRALNLGAEAASSPFHFALSAHCVASATDWVERSLSHYERSDVAATNGERFRPDGSPLTEVIFQTADTVFVNSHWGYSNHAGSWRATVWQQFPFDETLDACEDKEWSWRVLDAGWTIAFDPALRIEASHRRRAGVRALYRRVYKECRAINSLIDGVPAPLSSAVRTWWSEFPHPSNKPIFVRRMSPYRLTEAVARYRGEQAAARRSPAGANH